MTVSTRNAINSLLALEDAANEVGAEELLPFIASAKRCVAGIISQHGLLVRIKDIQNVLINTGEVRGTPISELSLSALALPGGQERIVYGEENTITELRSLLIELQMHRRLALNPSSPTQEIDKCGNRFSSSQD